MQWVCDLCGYIHDDDEPPDYCPDCGGPGSNFSEWDDDDAASNIEDDIDDDDLDVDLDADNNINGDDDFNDDELDEAGYN